MNPTTPRPTDTPDVLALREAARAVLASPMAPFEGEDAPADVYVVDPAAMDALRDALVRAETLAGYEFCPLCGWSSPDDGKTLTAHLVASHTVRAETLAGSGVVEQLEAMATDMRHYNFDERRGIRAAAELVGRFQPATQPTPALTPERLVPSAEQLLAALQDAVRGKWGQTDPEIAESMHRYLAAITEATR